MCANLTTQRREQSESVSIERCKCPEDDKSAACGCLCDSRNHQSQLFVSPVEKSAQTLDISQWWLPCQSPEASRLQTPFIHFYLHTFCLFACVFLKCCLESHWGKQTFPAFFRLQVEFCSVDVFVNCSQKQTCLVHHQGEA